MRSLGWVSFWEVGEVVPDNDRPLLYPLALCREEAVNDSKDTVGAHGLGLHPKDCCHRDLAVPVHSGLLISVQSLGEDEGQVY